MWVHSTRGPHACVLDNDTQLPVNYVSLLHTDNCLFPTAIRTCALSVAVHVPVSCVSTFHLGKNGSKAEERFRGVHKMPQISPCQQSSWKDKSHCIHRTTHAFRVIACGVRHWQRHQCLCMWFTTIGSAQKADTLKSIARVFMTNMFPNGWLFLTPGQTERAGKHRPALVLGT